MKNVLVDSCFWYAYLGTRRDNLQPQAINIYQRIVKLGCNVIIPFPSLYETINTELLRDKNKEAVDWFLQQLSQNSRFIKIYDDIYRERALESTKETRYRGISLVDSILRIMMTDSNLHIDTLITFNTEDFLDICTSCRIELINQETKFSD